MLVSDYGIRLYKLNHFGQHPPATLLRTISEKLSDILTEKQCVWGQLETSTLDGHWNCVLGLCCLEETQHAPPPSAILLGAP